MTGAPIPWTGADAVVPHEVTVADGPGVRFTKAVRAGQFILPRGGEMKAGEVVVPAGTVLGPAALGLLAAVGAHRRPASCRSASVHPLHRG